MTEKLLDLRGNSIEDGDLCIRTSFADKKSVMVYCVVFGDRAFYVKPNWRVNMEDLIDDIKYEGTRITSFKFEQYQIVKLNVLNNTEVELRNHLIKKLATCNRKGNFSPKYIQQAKELLESEV